MTFSSRFVWFYQLLVGLLLWVPLAQAAPPPIRIMPLGASITSGAFVSGGYRAPLYQLLTNANYTIDYVGTQTSNGKPGLPDSDHEGHGGYRIDNIDSGFAAWANAVADPDIILLIIGANDFAQNQDLQDVTNRLDHLISRITTHRPAAKLIVASLFLRTDYPDINETVQNIYDPAVPKIVGRHAALGEQVCFLDLHASLTSSDLSDGLHPNQSGYNKIATNAFNLITNLCTPFGITNPPMISHLSGVPELKKIVVSFNKPVMAEGVNTTNFALSGGLVILNATLDPVSQREVTLLTSQQNPSAAYTVNVRNIKELAPPHRTLSTVTSFQSAPTMGAFNNVPEATNYTLVYSLDIPNHAKFNTTGVNYDVDNHHAVHGFSRIAYYLELQPVNGPLQFVWVSMNAFCDDAARIGVPALGTDAFFQKSVTNLNVYSNVRGLRCGTGLTGGHLEFWPSAYGPLNIAKVPHASNLLYDFGDQPKAGEYGSMQIHNLESAETIFAFNHWANDGGKILDLGIGNSMTSNPDWTYAENAGSYSKKTLQVLVLPERKPSN